VGNGQNPLDTFPRSFSVDRKVANLLRTVLRTCYGETGVVDCGLQWAWPSFNAGNWLINQTSKQDGGVRMTSQSRDSWLYITDSDSTSTESRHILRYLNVMIS